MAHKCTQLLNALNDQSSKLVGSDLQEAADDVLAYVVDFLLFHHAVLIVWIPSTDSSRRYNDALKDGRGTTV
jgi:hypothetical protein